MSAVCDCGISWSYSLTIFGPWVLNNLAKYNTNTMIEWMWYFMLTQMNVKLCIYLNHALNKLMYRYCIYEKIIKYWEIYEGCSNMNASSFITFFTSMLRQKVIPFWKELFLAFQMAPNIKKHILFFLSYRPLYKGRSSILKFFWIKLQHTFWFLCGYSVISLLIWDKMTPKFSCKSK